MPTPAGFCRRYVAYSLDAGLLGLLALPWLWPQLGTGFGQLTDEFGQLQARLFALVEPSLDSASQPLDLFQAWLADPLLRASSAAMIATLTGLFATVAVTLFVLAAVYFIASESSPWQASPGKRLCRLRVTDRHGARASVGRISARFFAGMVSWLLLNLGHALAAWTPDKRALHDYLAGTRVELAPGAPALLPRWARAGLWLQLAAVVGALLLAALSYLHGLGEIAGNG